jgi:hypothetical protein
MRKQREGREEEEDAGRIEDNLLLPRSLKDNLGVHLKYMYHG